MERVLDALEASLGQQRSRQREREPLPTNMTASLLKGSRMNYEIPCDVPGYRFTRGKNGTLIGRCTACRVEFTVRETNDQAVRQAMAAHRDLSHGCGAR